MYYALTKDGNVLVTTANPYGFGLAGWSIHEMSGGVPDLNLFVWDDVAEEFVKNSSVLSKVDFILRLTPTEWAAVNNSTDVVVVQSLDAIKTAEYIDVADQRVINIVYYCASIGIITSNRIAEILA